MHQIKAEFECGKKETKILLEEAQQDYNSKFTLILVFFIFVFLHLNFLLLHTMHPSSLPFPYLFPGEKLHDLVALTQHDLAKLQLIEKLGWDYYMIFKMK